MEELIKRAQKGDKEAFTEIILSIRNELYKVAKTRIINENDIDDIIQETMIEAYKSIKQLRDLKKLKMWVIKILINKCNKFYKRKSKKDISLEETNINSIIARNNNEDVENDMNFYSLIKNLKYDERIVILLYYMEGYSVEEISEIIKMNKNTVKTNLYRARQKIKNEIEKKEALK